jgi:hypothetical protein
LCFASVALLTVVLGACSLADGGKEDGKGDADAKGKDLAGGCVYNRSCRR